eukprot:CAMPEP_0182440934 /NCGR_PEP_ID=MMETSP1167-20130531/87387_1 /TAXON_ID=2988 /ORGANISM="Mallomonas Sp, Strain CCMP3275" /LENGTH=99 /DNA_ID=CAMNT_0024635043 /DNA_START=1773 /DNA_END=2069 /DNA_ORIENTATION=-
MHELYRSIRSQCTTCSSHVCLCKGRKEVCNVDSRRRMTRSCKVQRGVERVGGGSSRQAVRGVERIDAVGGSDEGEGEGGGGGGCTRGGNKVFRVLIEEE